MNIKKILKEYGELNLQLKQVNDEIKEIIKWYRRNQQSVQVFEYFDYNKSHDANYSIDTWAYITGNTIHNFSYKMINLISLKKKLKRKISYRNRLIIKYGLDLSVGVQND